MEEITEIDMNKYIVIKKDDVEKYLISGWQKELERIELSISECRKAEEKPQNKYLVLNMDDEIDMIELRYLLYQAKFYNKIQRVSDIAVALVNAIIKIKT